MYLNKKLSVRKLERPNFSSGEYLGKFLMMGRPGKKTGRLARIIIGQVTLCGSGDLFLDGFSLIKDIGEEKHKPRQIVLGGKYIPEYPSCDHPLTDLLSYDKNRFYEFEKKLNIKEIITMMDGDTGKLIIEEN